jgi:hypothetical protein
MLRYVLSASICVGLAAGAVPAIENYARLPLSFEKHGDRFVARGQGYAIALGGARLTVGVEAKDGITSAVSLEFAGAQSSHAVPGPELPGKINYYRGNDPKKWQIGLPTYARVTYPDAYPGIDVAYYGNQQQLEFDLIVKPGADPEAIRLKVGGAGKLSIDDSGALNLGEAAGSLRVALPRIYQEVNGVKRNVPGRYAIVGRDEVAFKIDPWDRTRPLVIDPTITLSFVFGGGLGSNQSSGIGLDSLGNIVIAGYTSAADFPTLDAYQKGLKGSANAFVTKINPAGTALIYSTYLGGSIFDQAQALAVDSTGAAWVTGMSQSTDFPLLNAAQTTAAGAFVASLNTSGALQFSTYLGTSSTNGYGIAVDSHDFGYVTGSTSGTFPTTAGVIQQGSGDGATFVTKYASEGAVSWSTLLGGGQTTGSAIAVDSMGNAYITGTSHDSTFTGMPSGGAQTTNNGAGDAFVAKINPTATSWVYFTFLGGTGLDQGKAIAVDSSFNAYVAGQTSSTGLAKTGAAYTALAGATNGFAAKLSPSGSQFTYLTYLGGNRVDNLTGLALDGSQNVYLTGYSDSNNFPTVLPLQPTFPGSGVSLYNSTNSGGSWAALDANITGAVAAASINPSGTSIVVLTESGIYRTVNGGATWTQQSNVPFPNGYISRSPAAAGTIYAGVCCSTIYQSTDDGVTWTSVGTPPFQVFGILADPLTAGTLYLFGQGFQPPFAGVLKSTDGGAAWNPAATGLMSQASVGGMTATTDGSLYAAVAGSGVYKSTNQGGSWTAANSGLPIVAFYGYTEFNALSASGTTAFFVSLTDGTIYSTTNGGVSWAATPTFVGAWSIAPSPQNSSILYTVTLGATVQESTDGGTTWSAPGSGLAPAALLPYGQLVVDPGNSAHVLLVVPVNTQSFVAKLNSAGSALSWSTYLGGTVGAQAYAVATDGMGDVFVTGNTSDYGSFPVTSSALPAGQPSLDAFITEISDATAACSALSLSPASLFAPQSATIVTGEQYFNVAAPSGCAWTASTNESWVPITSGASGNGAGIITVQVAPNSTNATRSAFLTVGSQQATITQPGDSCVYTPNMSSYSLAAAGGTVSAFLTVTPGCPWAVANYYSSAISFTSASSGTGSAPLVMMVTPNLSSNPRNFTLSISASYLEGGAYIEIAQAAAATTASQTIEFDAIPNQILGISPFPIAAEASSLLPVSFMSTTPTVCKLADDLVTLLKAGMCSITASQAGNTGYSAATSVTRSFNVSVANPSGSFMAAAGSPFAVGMSPWGMAVGDFNGDGRPDLAIADFNGNSVTVLLGNGSGGFTPATGSQFALGTYPISLVVGDFNGDGNQDLAVANAGTNNVTVLLGNGSGGFAPAPGGPSPVGIYPISIAVGDFNGDGIQDVAVTAWLNSSSTPGTVTVLLGNGSGGFAAAAGSPITVGIVPDSVVAEDFNMDGNLDLAVANADSGDITLLLGNGSGGFTPAPGSPITAFGGTVGPMVVGDFNGDGIPDLAMVTSQNLVQAGVLLGNGSGGFTPAPGSPFTVGPYPFPNSLVVGDFNGDGRQDLAVTDSASNNVSVLLGNGGGAFTTAAGSPYAVGIDPTFLVVADFNGDGIEDLANVNYASNDVTVMLGFLVGNRQQTIMFGTLSNATYGVAPFTISATSNSGLSVSFASTTQDVCTLSGTTVTIVSATGTCSIVASQAGNATYAAATTVMQSFTVLASQTIAFGPLNDQTLNGTAPPPLSATANSGLTVAFTSNSTPVCTVSDVYVTLLTTGMCSITANQAGNASYAPAAPVTQTFTVSALGILPAAAFLDQTGAPALTFNGSTTFPDAGGFLIGAPGVAQDLNGNVYVVGLDSAGGVHLNSYSFANSTWNGWQYSGGILDTTSGLTAAVDPSGVVWFSGRDVGNRHWINSWNGAAFGGWILVADGIFSSDSTPQLAITSDGTVWIIGTDVGGRVWSNSYSQTSQTFTGWVDRQAVSIGQPSVTAGQDGFVYVAVRSVTTNSPVYITQIPAQNAATSNTWLNGGGLIDTDPQITSQRGTVYLMSLAGNNTVYLLTFSEATQTYGTWTFTNGILSSATIAAAAGNVFIAGLDSADRVYWYSLTGNSWFFADGAGISSTTPGGAK